MNAVKGFIKKRLFFVITILSIVLGGGLGGWLISAAQNMPNPVSNIVIDDFATRKTDTPGNFKWSLAIGENPENEKDKLEFIKNQGKTCLHIKRPLPVPGPVWPIMGRVCIHLRMRVYIY